MNSLDCTIQGYCLNIQLTEPSPDIVADQAVVDKVLTGDADAFGQLVNKYQDRVYSAALNYIGSPEEALDITQDAFLKAYTNLYRFKLGSSFYTWVYRIAINTAIDYFRKRRGRKTDSLEDYVASQPGYEPVSNVVDESPEPALARRESEKVLRSTIASLTHKLRAVLVLRDVEGLSQEEIAQILRIPVGTVKSRISRARDEMRKLLNNGAGGII